ncbi:YheO-like domain-containing protein [Thermodesulfobium narugense DSM 14796]|uniref:YheO-like domain-containing protein n=1 Tax=Thermodesulfobium narugense DSM 14796 TaxID=747365 RepID=M1E8E0_9BACT|nr:helix-turn-helix transcriptional regulator [Thermodesulfobium narugense]AEE14885.1 YheO-like domain-containing protein [Thermodesulfobium narugense DSM 14796]
MSIDERKVIFDNLINIADSICEMFGKNCEVAVHDLRTPERSLIHIAGDITHRQTGAPITDLVLKVLKKSKDKAKDMVGYKSVTKDGRILRSTTSFIRDKKGKIIGAFCVNFDVTEFIGTYNVFKDLLEKGSEYDKNETFAKNLNETIETLTQEAILFFGKQPSSFSPEEKIKFVSYLDEKGAFLIKGSVEYVASILGLSKFTVYSYLQKVRSSSNSNDD